MHPPVAVLPDALVVVVARRCWIDRSSGRSPVAVLVDEPAAWTQAPRHLLYGLFLTTPEVEQHQARADEIERVSPERLDVVVDDVVLDDLEVGYVESRQVAGVDVGGDHVAGRSDLPRQPHGHRAASRSDFDTAPASLDHAASLNRGRVVDLLE